LPDNAWIELPETSKMGIDEIDSIEVTNTPENCFYKVQVNDPN
jgi:hypothetical protein